ncbi:MAG: AMP-binding protein [Moraxellaceae bacterium]|nr:AMP-binding protein [Moraxellaceae bacterium]
MQQQKHPVERLLEHAKSIPTKTWLVQPVGDSTRTWTWAEATREIGRMASALQAHDWPKGSCIAISGRNTAHWFMADLAIQWAGYVSVGLYPKQSARSVRYILEHCEAKAVFLGPMPDSDEFVSAIPTDILKIGFPYVDAPVGTIDWDRMAQACSPLQKYQAPAPDALMTLIYTSGTTGNPKGAMITYGSIAWVAKAFLSKLPAAHNDERLFSFLPLAHVFERIVVEMASLIWRAEVHFLENIDRLPQQLANVAPTRFSAVPLVWGRFQAGILKQLSQRKLDKLLAVPVLGRAVQYKIRKLLGLQNVRLAASGAAPIPQTTLQWFKDTLGLTIYEGYGMSENCAYASANLPGQIRFGSVGKPFPDAGLRISEEGEVQIRHPGVMAGYYKDPEQTAKAFTSDGWLRTGDKGKLDQDGYLYITGRLKDIFKTAKGKYVSPALIESAFSVNTDIEHVCVIGNNLNQPVALVNLSALALEKPIQQLERDMLLTLDEVNIGLEDHERIAKVIISRDPWTTENGFITPTLKVRRDMLEDRYADFIAEALSDRKRLVAWH